MESDGLCFSLVYCLDTCFDVRTRGYIFSSLILEQLKST